MEYRPVKISANSQGIYPHYFFISDNLLQTKRIPYRNYPAGCMVFCPYSHISLCPRQYFIDWNEYCNAWIMLFISNSPINILCLLAGTLHEPGIIRLLQTHLTQLVCEMWNFCYGNADWKRSLFRKKSIIVERIVQCYIRSQIPSLQVQFGISVNKIWYLSIICYSFCSDDDDDDEW